MPEIIRGEKPLFYQQVGENMARRRSRAIVSFHLRVSFGGFPQQGTGAETDFFGAGSLFAGDRLGD